MRHWINKRTNERRQQYYSPGPDWREVREERADDGFITPGVAIDVGFSLLSTSDSSPLSSGDSGGGFDGGGGSGGGGGASGDW